MAVQPQTPYIEHVANGSTISFNLEFDCQDQDHLVVLVDDHEPIVGDWQLDSGAVIFKNAPKNGTIIKVQRHTPFKRDRDFQSYDNSFRPPAVNTDLDWIWWKLQELGVADQLLKIYVDRLHIEQQGYIENQDQLIRQIIADLRNYVNQQDDKRNSYFEDLINQQGVFLIQLKNYYNDLLQDMANIAGGKSWVAALIQDESGLSQQQINNKTVSTVDSITNLLAIKNPKDGQVIFVKGYKKAANFALLRPYKGGGDFVYVEQNKGINDGGIVINGYTRIVDLIHVEPEWFGCQGDGTTVDTTDFKKCSDYHVANDIPIKLSSKYRIDDEITISNLRGIVGGGRHTGFVFKANASFEILNASRLANLSNFSVDIIEQSSAITPCFYINYSQGHIPSFQCHDLFFNPSSKIIGNSRDGIKIKGANNRGFFSGFSFSGINSLYLNSDIRFESGDYWINSGSFKDMFNYAGKQSILLDDGAVISNCIFDNVQGQELENTTINLIGSASKCDFRMLYNWDTFATAIYLSNKCQSNSISMTHPHEITDNGYCTHINVDNVMPLIDTAISQSYLTKKFFGHAESIKTVFETKLIGTATSLYGAPTSLGSGLNHTGQIFTASPSETGSYIILRGSSDHEYEQYSEVRFIASFDLLTTNVDDFAVQVGISANPTNVMWLGVTIIAGKMMAITYNWDNTHTVLGTFGAAVAGRYLVQVTSQRRQSGLTQSIFINNKLVGETTFDLGAFKSPFIAVQSKTKEAKICLINGEIRQKVSENIKD